MKRLLLFLAAMPLVVSCNNDDDAPDAPFFNLAEGNMWVYRRYRSDSQGQNPAPTSQIDTVRVVGQEIIDGLSYYKLEHTGPPATYSPEYLRVNENGHLEGPGGIVMHPGTDANYTYTRYFEPYGKTDYKLGNKYDVEIEGITYSVLPYVGYFTAFQENAQPSGDGQIIAYQQGIGIITNKIRYLASPAYFEDRLIYYEVQ